MCLLPRGVYITCVTHWRGSCRYCMAAHALLQLEKAKLSHVKNRAGRVIVPSSCAPFSLSLYPPTLSQPPQNAIYSSSSTRRATLCMPRPVYATAIYSESLTRHIHHARLAGWLIARRAGHTSATLYCLHISSGIHTST